MCPEDPAAWDSTAETYRHGFEPFVLKFGQQALEGLALSPGARLLDLAAGTGGLALEAAARGVAVTAVDFSAASIRCLTRRAEAADRTVGAAVMDGCALALADAAFDAVISVFGHMFFTDRAMACSEVLRTLRPGGRFTTVVWGDPGENQSQSLMRQAAATAGIDLTPKAPPPTWASLCMPDAAARELRAMGFMNVREEAARHDWDVPSAAWLAAALPTLSPVSAALFRPLSQSRRRDLMDAYRTVAEAQFGPGAFSLSATARIVSGTRP